MGKKISIDSSNLMNKILELIEAYKIFLFDPKKYEIIIHPQSLIHAIVLFKNGQSKFLFRDGSPWSRTQQIKSIQQIQNLQKGMPPMCF